MSVPFLAQPAPLLVRVRQAVSVLPRDEVDHWRLAICLLKSLAGVALSAANKQVWIEVGQTPLPPIPKYNNFGSTSLAFRQLCTREHLFVVERTEAMFLGALENALDTWTALWTQKRSHNGYQHIVVLNLINNEADRTIAAYFDFSLRRIQYIDAEHLVTQIRTEGYWVVGSVQLRELFERFH